MVNAGMVCTVFLREHLGQWLLIVAIADDQDGAFMPVVFDMFATRDCALRALRSRELVTKALAMELPELDPAEAEAARYIMEFPDEALAESVVLTMDRGGAATQ